MFEVLDGTGVVDTADPNPPPRTNNHNNGVNVDATSLLFSLKKTLNSLNQIAYSLPNSRSRLKTEIPLLFLFLCILSIPFHKPALCTIFVMLIGDSSSC